MITDNEFEAILQHLNLNENDVVNIETFENPYAEEDFEYEVIRVHTEDDVYTVFVDDDLTVIDLA